MEEKWLLFTISSIDKIAKLEKILKKDKRYNIYSEIKELSLRNRYLKVLITGCDKEINDVWKIRGFGILFAEFKDGGYLGGVARIELKFEVSGTFRLGKNAILDISEMILWKLK